ncbi:MAG: hypothetical protein V3T48_06630, partial [Vicinamibacterales bacterium]
MATSPDPSTQLMQLRKAESLGVLHDHDGSVGDVHPDFDHGCGHQEIDRVVGKPTHHLLALVGFHPPVDQPDSVVAKDYLKMRRQLTQGRQVYVVYPLVEESAKLDVKAATEMA